MTRAAIALLAVAAAGCGASRHAGTIPEGTGPLVGVYRAVFRREGEPDRRARLALWAERPDRLHAELSAPVGGIRLTLDAGAGRAVVVDAAEGVAYVGDAGPATIAAVTGVSIGVPEAVAALLDGTPQEAVTIEREGEEAGRLPARLTIATRGTALSLERLRWERGAGPVERLGTGIPPAGLTVRPLADLAAPPPGEP